MIRCLSCLFGAGFKASSPVLGRSRRRAVDVGTPIPVMAAA
jgi:hypothetical protein